MGEGLEALPLRCPHPLPMERGSKRFRFVVLTPLPMGEGLNSKRCVETTHASKVTFTEGALRVCSP